MALLCPECRSPLSRSIGDGRGCNNDHTFTAGELSAMSIEADRRVKAAAAARRRMATSEEFVTRAAVDALSAAVAVRLGDGISPDDVRPTVERLLRPHPRPRQNERR